MQRQWKKISEQIDVILFLSDLFITYLFLLTKSNTYIELSKLF